MIPDAVGELDCLAYSPQRRSLLLAEAKYMAFNSEAAQYRNEVQRFTKKRGYFAQLTRKADWVAKNFDAVCRALESTEAFDFATRPVWLDHVMITDHPMMVSCLATEFPCVSFSELAYALEQSPDAWPFQVGRMGMQ